jgi:MFS superfamily sulfate permease-like transporter
VAVVGTVPRSLPTPAIPDIAAADLVRLIPAAFGLAIVGYTDNVLTARAFSEGEPIDANREFLALGATNLAGGLLRGFPVSSSGSRTAIGAAVGAKTQLSAVVTAITVFVAMLAVGPALGHFPMAALGGVVVFAAAKLVEVGEIRRIARFRRSELFLAAVAFLGVLVTDVLVGIAVAIGLSILDLLRRVARPHDAVLGYVPGVPGMHDVDDYPNAVTVPGLMVYRYDSPLFFANAEDFRRRAMAAVDASDTPITWFVLNAEGIVEVDLTGIDALDDLRSELTRRDIVFGMARVKHDLADDLEAAGFLRKVGPDRLFATLPTAVAAFQASAVTD